MKKNLVICLVILFSLLTGMANDDVQTVFEEYLESFLNGDYERAILLQTAELTAVFNLQSMEQSAGLIISQYGKAESEYSTELIEQEGYYSFLRTMKTTKGYIRFTVTVNEDFEIAGFYAAPVPAPIKTIDYVQTEAIEEREVRFGIKDWELEGLLTLPVDHSEYPLVIIVGGSGPTDMNGTVGPNTPYKDIAQGLASKGVAVLRYNKRTAQYASKINEAMSEIKNMVEFEYVEDIFEALEYAAAIEEVTAIFLAGHSLGGTIVPKIAAESERVDGLILLAPGVRRLAQISIDQNKYAKEHLGISDEQIEQVIQFFSMILNHELDENYPIQAGLTAEYYYEMDNYSPIDDLSEFKKPVLVLQGEEDFQATMEGDFLPLKNRYNDDSHFTFISLDGINHLFMKVEKGVFHWTDEYNIPGFVDKRVIDQLSQWIHLNK